MNIKVEEVLLVYGSYVLGAITIPFGIIGAVIYGLLVSIGLTAYNNYRHNNYYKDVEFQENSIKQEIEAREKKAPNNNQ